MTVFHPPSGPIALVPCPVLQNPRPTRRYSPGPPYHWPPMFAKYHWFAYTCTSSAPKNGVLGQSCDVVNAMHMMPAAAGFPSCSTDVIVADCGHAFTVGPDGAAGYDTMTLLRSIASDVVKLCAAEVPPVIELAASRAVARHHSGALIGRSDVGMKPVSLTPSLTVAVTISGLNVEDAATSNL